MRRSPVSTARSACAAILPRRTTIAATRSWRSAVSTRRSQSFDRALALRADYAEAHHNRGTALNELGRFDEAQEAFDRALSVQMEDGAAG